MNPKLPILRQLEGDIDFAFIEFGLSEEQFLRQTPREWRRRFRAWKAREERIDRRVARICWAVAASQGYKGGEEDFIPRAPETEFESFEDIEAAICSVATKGVSHGR